MLIEGVLFLLAIPAVYKQYHEISGGITVAMIVFIAVFAVGSCILTCFFSVNESKEVVTLASKIHGAGSVIGFMLFLFVPLLMAILSFKGQEKVMGFASVICFVLALVFFTLFVMSDKPEFKKTLVDNEGLWQRLNLICMYLPLVFVAAGNIRGSF
jgi:cobalamin synthase